MLIFVSLVVFRSNSILNCIFCDLLQTNNPITDNTWSLSRPISFEDVLQPASSTILQNISRLHGLSFVQSIVPTAYIGSQICLLRPKSTQPIVGDGNCLFSSMSQLLTGSSTHGNRMRAVICDHMCKLPFTANHIQSYSRYACGNINDYIVKERMYSDGVYGGDMEIKTFCSLPFNHNGVRHDFQPVDCL